MAEVAFAKSFLSALDSRPIKLSADHVEDPRNFPARSAQILPKMPKPMTKPRNPTTQDQQSLTIHLKSLKNPPIDLTLPSQGPNTSILDLKNALDAETRIPAAKIKILLNRKPVSDSKVLRDLVRDGETALEFSVMVMGGAAAVRPVEGAASAAASPPTGAEGVAGVETKEFWDDLRGYLMQRLKDEKQAEELHGLFKASWDARE